MDRKTHIDMFGAAALFAFAIVLAFNQVVIKVTNGGFGPVFAAGLRSLIGLSIVLLWIVLRRKPLRLTRDLLWSGLLVGGFFTFEFICLFIALDLTTVARSSVIFYSMPVWLALVGHFVLPGERLTAMRLGGLCLAMLGVVVALADRNGGQASLFGDLLALAAALGWAGIVLTVRLTPLAREKAETQLLWQLLVSAVMLLALSPLFGPLLREVEMIHLAGLAFQGIGVVAIAFLIWFWLMSIYPASGVASFSFLSPVFSVLLGWLLLGEHVGPSIWVALGLVALGLVFINRR